MDCKYRGWMLLALLVLPFFAHAQGTLTISPSTLPNGKVGEPYSVTLTATGGEPPYTFTLTSGTLPDGVAFSSDGTLSGTPTGGGRFNFSVAVTDSNGDAGEQNYHWDIDPPTITVSPATLPSASYGESYSQTLSASGGTAPYSFAVSAGTLPSGLSLSSAGVLSGTPSEAGTFTFTVTATDSSTGSGPYTGDQTYMLQVTGPTLTLSPPSGTLTAQYGQSFSQTFTASGGAGPYNYDLAGSLPNGLSWDAGSHTISGTPTQTGSFPFAVTATDSGSGASVTQNYILQVGGPNIALAPSSLPDGTVGSGYSATVTASGGDGPYRFSITRGALPAGISLSSGGQLSGTPTAAGAFSFTITATDSNGQTGSRDYSLDIAGATITLSPASLPTAKPEQPYSQTFSASGGTAPYHFAVTAGSLPAGLTLSGSTLSGTPTTSGTFTFTVTATDSSSGSGGPFSGSRNYTLIVSTVNITLSPATLPAMKVDVAVNQQLSASGGSGSYTFSVTSGKLPPGLALSSSGSLTGTPSSAGTYTFTVTARDRDGFTGARTYTASVVQGQAVPVAAAQKAAVVAGESVTIDATKGATGAPFTGAAISSPPAVGTATVQGTDIVYSAPADASGTVTFEYTLSNAAGTSQPAQVTITIGSLPVAPALSAEVPAGATVRIDITSGATGGPFKSASIVSISPPEAGTAVVEATDGGFAVDFSAAADFTGAAELTYTLTNASATSAPATISITVTEARPDPSQDAEVLGVLAAQASATRRMAQGQIDNFSQRLESLHDRSTVTRFTNGISLSSLAEARARNLRRREAWWHPEQDLNPQRYLVQPQYPVPADAVADGGDDGILPDGFSFWTAGAIDFGNRTPASSSGIDFTTSGITIGADQQMGDDFTLGAGLGYGHDTTDIGDNGSRSTSDSYNVAVYGSYHPRGALFIDGLLGYQMLSLDERRYIAADGGMVQGSRDGRQWFGSLSVGYEHRTFDIVLVPYARVDVARARLDAYEETGDATYALGYGEQNVNTTTGNLGVRLQWSIKHDYGVWMPSVRAEYRHDFQGSSAVDLRYVDLLSGPLYRASEPDQSHDHLLVGAGVQLQTPRWSLRFEYRNLLDTAAGSDQAIVLGFSMSLP